MKRLASLTNKALASAADATAVAGAAAAAGVAVHCFPIVLAGLGLAVWDVFREHQQDREQAEHDADTREALQALRALLGDSAQVQRRLLLDEAGRQLAADAIAQAEQLGTQDLAHDDLRRPYLILHRFLRQEFDSSAAAEQATRDLILELRGDVVNLQHRLDAGADERFTAVCGPRALSECEALLDTHRRVVVIDERTARTEQKIDLANAKLDALAAAPAAAEVRVLAAAPAYFTGRIEQRDALLRALDHGQGGAIDGAQALHGAPGIGKSTLARVVAHLWLAKHPGRPAVEIDLRGARENAAPVAPATALAQLIRYFVPDSGPLPDDVESLRPLYLGLLAQRRPLVLLDNARDLAQVEPLLPPAGCALLVTSREYLDLPGLQPCHLEELPRDKSCELLLALDPALAPCADAIAAACDDIPKALEIAGCSRRGSPLTTPADVLAGLRGARHAAHDAIDAALRFSTSLLPTGLAAAWATLGVFPTSFEEDAAAAVWEVAPTEARARLERLWRASLVEIDPTTHRSRLHDRARTVALGALGALTTPDAAADAARLRHARHYRRIGGKAGDLYLRGGDDVLRGLALFDNERAHLDAAFAWLAARTDIESATLLLELVNAVVYTGSLRFHPREHIRWLEAQRTAARRTGDRHGEGNALGNLGLAHADLGDPRTAIGFHEQALAISREIGDRRGEGSDLGNLGNAHAALGDPRTAIGFYEQRLAIAREIGDRHGEGNALGNLGNAHAALGDPRTAIGFHEQALAIAREIGDRRSEGSVLGNLGNAHAALGDPRSAIGFYEQRLAIAREIGDSLGEANALFNSAGELAQLDQPAEALKRARAALAIFEAMESPGAEDARRLIAFLMEFQP